MVSAGAANEIESPAPSASLRLRGRGIVEIACVAVAAGAIAIVAKALLFPLMSGDSDEPVYVYQARMLVQGHVTLAARVHGQFFHPWLFGQHGDRLFSQYQPGWPAVIAVAHVLGNEQIALVVAAAAAAVATWFLAREFSPGSSLFAVALLLLSPIFVVHSALYLSYLWTTALVIGGLAAALAALRSRRPAAFVACGALFGVAQLTRPFDAFIVAVPTFAFVGWRLLRDRKALATAAAWIGVGLLPLLVATAVYNAHVTGSPARFPLQAAEHADTFGFGARKMAADQPVLDYTPHRAWTALNKSASAVPRWFAGGGLGLALAVAAVWMARRRSETWLLVTLVFAFPFAYFFWWATVLAADGASTGLGPHYYVPAFAPLAVLGGYALQRLFTRSRLLVALAIVAVAAGSVLSFNAIRKNAEDITDGIRAKHDALAAAHLKNAVVVLRADPRTFTLLDNGFLVGNPELNGNVLYAIDRGPDTVDLAADFPTRHLYQLVLRDEPGDALLHPSYVVEPLDIRQGPTPTMHFDVENTSNAPVVMGYVKVGDQIVATQTLDKASRSGAHTPLTVTLIGDNDPAPAPRAGTLVARVPGNGQVSVGIAFGPDENLDHADVYERRYDVAARPGHIAVQTPGLHFHLFRFKGDVWVAENVGPHLAERG